MKSNIDWSTVDADLGKVPDAVIAKRIGCDRRTVRRRREALGIPRAPASTHQALKTAGRGNGDPPAEAGVFYLDGYGGSVMDSPDFRFKTEEDV